MSESFEDQLSRVQLMADPKSGTWDLSKNDCAALQAVLADRARLIDTLKRIATEYKTATLSCGDVGCCCPKCEIAFLLKEFSEGEE